MELSDGQLWRQRAFLAGQWVAADNGETLGVVPRTGAAETRRAIEAAEQSGRE